MAKKLSIEESFEQLDTSIGSLQQGDLSLEESFQKYEDGMKLIKHWSDTIDKVEKKLEIIEQEETEGWQVWHKNNFRMH